MATRKRQKLEPASRDYNCVDETRKLSPELGPAATDTAGSHASARRFPSDRGVFLAASILVLAGIAAYLNSFAGVFVFDDKPCITENRSIRQLWPLGDVLFPPRELEVVGVSGRPLLNLSFAINYALGGDNPWGYHAVNLAIHLLAGLTLFGIVRRTLRRPLLQDQFGAHATILALAVALLWTVHPVQTESVTYVVQRAESLVGLFYLATLYCVLRGATGGQQKTWYATAAVICLFGMTTKEVMVTAPVVILLYDRTFLAGSFREALRQRTGLYLALAATWSAIVWGLISSDFHHGTTGFAVQDFTPWSYLATQPGVILHYVRLAFWPVGLCFDYNWPVIRDVEEVLLPGMLVTASIGFTCWAVWKRPPLGFLGAWFFLVLAPTSSLVPIQDAAFEHRLYLSLAAISAAVVLVAYAFLQESVRSNRLPRTRARKLELGLLFVVAVALAGLTIRRNRDYFSDLALWRQTVEQAPDNPRANHNLGQPLVDSGRMDEAIRCYQKAIALKPNLAQSHYCLGNIYVVQDRLEEAIVEYQAAIEAQSDYSEAEINLAGALAKRKRPQEAQPHFERALKLAPDNAEVHNNFATALIQLGKLDEAVIHFKKALELKPDFTEARMNFAALLSQRQNFPDAVAQLREGIKSQPRDPVLVNQLAWVLATCPDDAIRNGREAVFLAEQASRLAVEQNSGIMDTLAAAQAESGDFVKAVAWQIKAFAAAPDNAKPDFASRLELYQAGKPYREEPRLSPRGP